MGFKIIRFFKAWREITDKYEGTFKCSKDLDATLNFIKNTWPDQQAKSLYRCGRFRVAKDVNWNTWHEIELQVQAQHPVTKQVLKVTETISFRIQYFKNVVTQITLDLRAVDSKATFDEFQKALDELPNVEATAAAAPAPVKEESIDLSDKTMSEALDVFEKAVTAFGENVGAKSFATLKAVKEEISKKIKALEPKEKALFTAAMSKIDTFVNAINMQLSNPAMAAAAASMAGTYVAQMLTEIAQMQALC